MFKKSLPVLLLMLFAAILTVHGQQSQPPTVLAVDWAIGGTIVAVALPDEVLIYDMHNPDEPPRRFPSSITRALAFSQDSYRTYQGQTVKVFRLAIGSASGIKIIDPDTLEVLYEIDQPASALIWLNNDIRLFAGWQNTVYIYDANWLAARDNNNPYQLREQIALPEIPPEQGGGNGGSQIKSIQHFNNQLYVRWLFTPAASGDGHGGTYFYAGYWADDDDPELTLADDGWWDLLFEADHTRYAAENTRVLVNNGNRGVYWIDLQASQVIQLPIQETL